MKYFSLEGVFFKKKFWLVWNISELLRKKHKLNALW